MSRQKIKVLQIEPMMPPKVYYIEPTMKAFRDAVNADNIEYGGVEAKKLERQVYAIFNKHRFLADLEPNRRIGDDIIAGTMYVVAINEHRFPISLTDEQTEKYALRFWNIETFDDIDVAEANINTLLSRLWKDEKM